MTACYGVSRNPLEAPKPEGMLSVQVGLPISSTMPNEPGQILCIVNGALLNRLTAEQCAEKPTGELYAEYCRRADEWQQPIRHGDVIVWLVVPEGREGFRTLLQVAAIVVSIWAPYLSPYVLAANVAYNLLVPPALAKQPQQAQQTDDNFSTSLSGNVARIDQPIWKSFGHVEITPPFACEPYYEYLPRVDATDPELDRDQYYYALFAVGIGNQDVVAKLANTPLSRFEDVVAARYLSPGELPISVNANVTTAPEVSTAQILDTSRYVGGFAACPARQTVTHVGIDVAAPKGLGETVPLSVSWRVEYRPINDFGQALGNWAMLAEETRTAFTSTPQNWSNKYAVPGDIRPEIRLVRTDLENTAPLSLHQIAWVGLRAYRGTAATLNPLAAHYEVVMRASSQLSNQTSRDFRLICDCYSRQWSEEDGWTAETKNRNPVWSMLSLCSEEWGLNQPDERIDLPSFAALAAICDERQDRFDYTFDTTISAWDALQLIARTCRSRAFKRNGVISVARDQLADLPVTAFSPRNSMPDTMRINEILRKYSSPDGVIVQYRDHRTREWTDIECPCPGVMEMVNPIYKRLDGVIGAYHAAREGMYEAANILYRNRTVEWTTELQGMVPAYMSPVSWQPEIANYGQSGDVAFWDADTLTMGLTEPVDFSSGVQYLSLIRDDNTVTAPVLVQPGAGPNDVQLEQAPDFELVLDDGTRERPKYLLGPIGAAELVKVSSIADGGQSDEGAQLYKMGGVIDDDRVHLADVDLLPGPGDIQDPIGLPDEEPGGGFFPIVRLLDYTHADQFSFSAPDPGGGYLQTMCRVVLTASGVLKIEREDAIHGLSVGEPYNHEIYENQWLIGSPADPVFGARFDVFAEILVQYVDPGADEVTFTGTIGSWVSLATDQTWQIEVPPVEGTGRGNWNIRLIVRDAATLLQQDQTTVDAFGAWNFIDDGSGGGGD